MTSSRHILNQTHKNLIHKQINRANKLNQTKKVKRKTVDTKDIKYQNNK